MKTEYQKACTDLNYKPARNRDKETGKMWVANFLNSTGKWWAWFWANEDKSKPAGVGFSFFGTFCGGSDLLVGSRLLSKTETIAKEAAKTPEISEYYNEFLR